MSSKSRGLFLLCLLLSTLKIVHGNLPVITGPSSVQEGHSVMLYCSYEESSANLTWLKDGRTGLPSGISIPTPSNLTILNANYMSHSGLYTCLANYTDGTGAMSSPFNLTVEYLHGNAIVTEVRDDGDIVSVIEKNKYRVISGSTVTLKCQPPTGYPQPMISWTYYGKPISDSRVSYHNMNTVLMISNIQSSNFGRYGCTANNTIGNKVSEDIVILVHEPDSISPTEPEDISVVIPVSTKCSQLTSDVVIPCTISGTYTNKGWFKGNTKLTTGSKYTIGNDTSLTIKNIQNSDVGIYKCSASRSDDSASDTVSLQVKCIHSVTIQGSLLVGIEGTLKLNCSSDYSHHISNPNLSWRKPNSDIIDGSLLQLTNLTFFDGGTYTCTASSLNSEPSHSSVEVIVEGSPIVKVTATPPKAMLNHSLVLTCKSNTTNNIFQWKNGSADLVAEGSVSITSFSNISVLNITRVTSDKNNAYSCILSNSIHSGVTQVLQVNMSTDIYLLRDLDEVKGIRNKTLQVLCPVAGGRGVVMVTWYRGSTPLPDPANGFLVSGTNDNTLIVSSLTLNHEGMYSCNATDELHQVFSQEFHITVNVPGRFISHPAPIVERQEGSTIQLDCVVEGKPKPEIKWIFGIEPIQSNRHINASTNGSLIINNLRMTDKGIYICSFVRIDTGGTDLRKFELKVVSQQTTPSGNTDNQNTILGLHESVFIAVILGAVGVVFIILIILLLCLLCCYCICCRQRNNNNLPKAILETTSFERRPSLRGSLRKDNSGILQQSPSNVSSLWTFAADTTRSQTIPMTIASSSVAVSPGPPVPSPIPPPDGPTASLATELHLPNDVHSFPRQNLHLSSIMGEGEFGPVFKGVARHITPGEKETNVAVKVLMPREGDDHLWPSLMDFASQMKLSSPFVARILGLCADGEPFYVIYQYLDRGDLKSFLMNSRPSPHHQPSFTQNDLLHIIAQTAEGMLYLYTQQIIHGDLATRNCLIGSDFSVKIADLGIGHDLYEHDYYDNGTQLLPIRWMAPELLRESDEGPAFSLSSDVWSFGVFCWEVFAYARQPYTQLTDKQVLQLVPDGHMLDPPEEGCPPLLYSLMMDCWLDHPHDRPAFSEITGAVQSIEVD